MPIPSTKWNFRHGKGESVSCHILITPMTICNKKKTARKRNNYKAKNKKIEKFDLLAIFFGKIAA